MHALHFISSIWKCSTCCDQDGALSTLPDATVSKWQGPTGNKHILQTAGGMWNLQLQGRMIADDSMIWLRMSQFNACSKLLILHEIYGKTKLVAHKLWDQGFAKHSLSWLGISKKKSNEPTNSQWTHLAAQPGVALSAHDRIRIVPDTVLCGLTGSATMHSSVLVLTSPSGQRYSVSRRLSPLSIRIGSDHDLMIQTLNTRSLLKMFVSIQVDWYNRN